MHHDVYVAPHQPTASPIGKAHKPVADQCRNYHCHDLIVTDTTEQITTKQITTKQNCLFQPTRAAAPVSFNKVCSGDKQWLRNTLKTKIEKIYRIYVFIRQHLAMRHWISLSLLCRCKLTKNPSPVWIFFRAIFIIM